MSTDIIVGFPGETDDDFRRTLEVAAAAEYDYAYTFVFSPRPGTEAATMVEHFVDPAVTAERFERLRVVVERSALAKHRARIGRIEEVLVEGPSKQDPRCSRVAPARTSWSTSPPPQPLRTGCLRDGRDHRGGTAPPDRSVRRADRRADSTSGASPSWPGDRAAARRSLGPTASGKSDVAMALAAAELTTAEIVAVDAMQVYRGMDIGTAKPTADDRRCVPHHCIDLVEPADDFTVAEFARRRARGAGGIADRGAPAVLVAGTGLYLRSVTDPMEIPGHWPEVRPSSRCAVRRRRGSPALHAELAGARSGRGRRGWSRPTPVGWCAPSR